MSAINKLKIYNFKAFYQENEIDFNAKHLLLYGENGSGKSSIYWSLYTLLQSENKTNGEIQKYFIPIVDENLINYNYLKARADYETEPDGRVKEPQNIGLNANIEMELSDADKSKFIIDSTGFSAKKTIGNAEVDDIDGKQKLRNLNRHSDFISHRLLINFYNFRNSKEINLWEVFIRDMFPFLKSDKGASDSTLWDRYNNLDNILPYNYYANGTFARSGSGYRKQHLLDEITKLNEDIDYWISQMNLILNTFYVKHFEPLYKDKLRITLTYGEPLEYEHYKTQYQFKDNKWYERGTGFAGFNEPHIGLKLETENPDGTFTLIHRPQSYLNEARLTSIALAVRFSLLDDTIRPPFSGQFLALDDLLVSLDMSNRDKILDIILTEFAPKYKIYLFTHERAFFNMAKARIESEHDPSLWSFQEIYGADEDNEKPTIKPSNSYIAQSIEQYKNKDYPASVNYLRKELESLLDKNVPKKVLKSASGEDLSTLDGVLDASIKHVEKLGLDSLPLKKCKQYLQILLNPLSHNENDVNAYEVDIKRIRKILEDLKPFLEDLKKNTKEVLSRNQIIQFTLLESDGITKQVYNLFCKNEMYCYKDSLNTISITNCEVNSKESRTYKDSELEVKADYRNEHWKADSLHELAKKIFEYKEMDIPANYLEYFTTEIDQKLSELLQSI